MEAIQKTTKTKSKRIKTIDFVRGISVLLMIPVHVMIVYSTVATWEATPLGKVIQILEKGTPMFLVVMGMSFVFSGKLNVSTIFLRGFRVLATGYLLNVMRFLVPLAFFGGFPDSFVQANGLTPGASENYVFYGLLGDILQLAGISLIIMGLIIKFIKNKYAALIFTFLIVLLAKEIAGFRPGIPVVDYLCDLLWGKNYNVYFPVFPWMSFILIGLFFGMWYREKGNDVRFMIGKMLPFGIAFIALGLGLCIYDKPYHFGDYYHLGPGGSIILMGINLLLIWTGHLVVKFVPQKLYDIIAYASRNVTNFYFIQWVIIYWGVLIFGYSLVDSQVQLLLTMVGYTALTFGVLWVRNTLVAQWKQKRAAKKSLKRAAA